MFFRGLIFFTGTIRYPRTFSPQNFARSIRNAHVAGNVAHARRPHLHTKVQRSSGRVPRTIIIIVDNY